MSANSMRNIPLAIATAAGVLLAAGSAQAQDAASPDILIRGAKVYTVSARGVLDHADVLVHDGRIADVFTDSARHEAHGARVVDANGRALTPGIFAGLSHIGVEEISAESSTVDASANFKAPAWDQQWRPEFDVTLAYNPRSTLVPVARIEGLTWTELAPSAGDSIIAGQGGAVAFDGRIEDPAKAVLDGSRTLFVQLGSDAERFSGGSRAAAYMLLEQAIAESHGQGPAGSGALLHPAGRMALARYLSGGRVVFDVERVTDILAVIDFAGRHHLEAVISGGSEAPTAATLPSFSSTSAFSSVPRAPAV